MSATEGTFTMTGVEALLRVPLDQVRADAMRGRRAAALISGYQGSPLGGVPDVYDAHRAVFEAHDVRFIAGVNEDLGATMVWGSQLAGLEETATYDGVLGMWFGKGPGLDRSGDAIRHANFSGVHTHGGVVLAVGDDPSCKSSSIPCGSEWSLADLAVPTFYPGNVREVLTYGRAAYEISRYAGCWVALKMHSDVADGYAALDVADPLGLAADLRDLLPATAAPVQRQAMVSPHSVAAEGEAYSSRLTAAGVAAAHLGLDRTVGASDARLGVIAAGPAYGQVRDVLEADGLGELELERIGVRLLKPALIWPLDRATLAAFAEGLNEILVLEDKREFLETQVRDLLYGSPRAPRVTGRRNVDGSALVPVGGALSSTIVRDAMRTRLADVVGFEPPVKQAGGSPVLPLAQGRPLLPLRSPFTCSGCPHNTSTVLPEGSIGHGGIGCHGMVLKMDRGVVGITHMGAEGTQWVGTAPFVSDAHRFQNIGDGTLSHSGFLAIRQAVAAGATITYKVLYNSTVAMTGGQDVPGGLPVPALARELLAEGVRRVVVVTNDRSKFPGWGRGALPHGVRVRHRDRLNEVQRELRDLPGVTVLIYDQECAAELRRARKRRILPTPERRVHIDEAICEGCGDCGQVSNCASLHPVETSLGRKTRVDQDSCNYDESCLKGNCPAFVSVKVRRGGIRAPAEPARREAATRAPLEEPVVPSSGNVLITGVGGAGVTTVSRVLAAAAELDGSEVIGMDQTGLAQKGGAVVSHIRIRRGPVGGLAGGLGSSRVPDGATDLLLVFDAITAAQNVSLCSPDTTVAVASTHVVPTGEMVSGRAPDPVPHLAPYRGEVDARTRSQDNVWLDVVPLAQHQYGDSQMSNLILLGVAYQGGHLPVSARSIERALEANGARVESNLAAFRLGRRIVLEPTLLATLTPAPSRAAASNLPPALRRRIGALVLPGSTSDSVSGFVSELLDSRDVRVAGDYLATLEQARSAELALGRERSDLTATAALHLFRLTAYKDEYEVARLALRSSVSQDLPARYGQASVRYLLHPPSLRRLGLRRKIALPARVALPMFRVLHASRRLRGTWADPFGRSADRKLERSLAAEYRVLIGRIVTTVTVETYDEAVEVLALAEQIRGYEDVKRDAVQRYREALAVALTRSFGTATI